MSVVSVCLSVCQLDGVWHIVIASGSLHAVDTVGNSDVMMMMMKCSSE